MANFLENVIEKMIRDGIVTESELQARIVEEREKSPIPPLQEADAVMFYDSMIKDARIADLETMNSDLTYIIMMGGTQ